MKTEFQEGGAWASEAVPGLYPEGTTEGIVDSVKLAKQQFEDAIKGLDRDAVIELCRKRNLTIKSETPLVVQLYIPSSVAPELDTWLTFTLDELTPMSHSQGGSILPMLDDSPVCGIKVDHGATFVMLRTGVEAFDGYNTIIERRDHLEAVIAKLEKARDSVFTQMPIDIYDEFQMMLSEHGDAPGDRLRQKDCVAFIEKMVRRNPRQAAEMLADYLRPE